MRLVFLIISIAISGLVYSQNIKPIADWDSRIIEGTGKLPANFRNQVADLVYGGDRRFAVAYLDAEVEGETGRVQLLHVNLTNNSVVLLPKSDFETNWLRAATGGPIDLGGCSLQVQLSTVDGPSLQLKQNPEYVNYFTYRGVVNGQWNIILLKVRWCNGGFMSEEIPVAQGSFPSVAIATKGNETKLLMVYINNETLFGRFVNPLGEPLGPEFLISTIEDSALSTDIIWNSVSQKFIIGYMRGKTGIDSFSPELCSVNNVLVDWNGVVETPTLRGICDGARKGHHTSVDFNPQNNKNGRYYWWFQDLQGSKSLHLMDSIGRPLAGPDLIGTAWTYPVARTRSKKISGPIMSIPNAQTDPLGNYVYIRKIPPQGGDNGSIAVEFLSNNGNVDKLGSLPGVYALEILDESKNESVFPVSILNLHEETILLWRHNLTNKIALKPPEPGWVTENAQWGLTVFKHEKKQQVMSSEER